MHDAEYRMQDRECTLIDLGHTYAWHNLNWDTQMKDIMNDEVEDIISKEKLSTFLI